MTALMHSAIIANSVQLSVVTDLLFRQRMHRPIAETCSAVALYQYANAGNEVKTSFVVVPGVGGAGYATWNVNGKARHEVGLVVFEEVTEPGVGQLLMDELVRHFGSQIPLTGVKSQEPTTSALARARQRYPEAVQQQVPSSYPEVWVQSEHPYFIQGTTQFHSVSKTTPPPKKK